jgi:ABC-type transport system involved in cytochrome c biogenesis permease subunit
MTRSALKSRHTEVCSRHPVLAVILLELTILVAMGAGVAVLVASGNQKLALTDGTAPVLFGFGVLAPVLVAYLVLSRKASIFGFRKIRRGCWLAYSPAAVVLVVTIAANGFYFDQSQQVMIGRAVPLCLLVGFVEETIYRA